MKNKWSLSLLFQILILAFIIAAVHMFYQQDDSENRDRHYFSKMQKINGVCPYLCYL